MNAVADESESGRCSRCGEVLPSGALGRACPRCMLQLGFESTGVNLDTADEATSGSSSSQETRRVAKQPDAIGRYRILRLIGEGGMGTVYEAEQQHPRRVVALKIVKPGMASPELLRRFDQESQALGRLQHPGIAQIYEAGTADTGFGLQPYFSMELIRGKTLMHYSRDRQLSPRQRLEMMASIAEAAHHAHQRGLIHRDLKPSNILVDETGQPKILDFGVARVTDSDTQATSRTDMGHLVGTLAYMSPEQVLADPLELDTRSDVYALGVILYELLSGRLPYTIGKNLHEAIQAIREEDPSRLSSIDRAYRGDIETIVAKALEKDKTRRYGSAAEFAADIRRYLHDEPIAARPPNARYQLRKFARRNKAMVFGLAAVFVALAAGAVVSTNLAIRAERERERALVAEAAAKAQRDRASEAEAAAKAQRDVAIASEQQAGRDRDYAIAERLRADAAADTARNLRLGTLWQSLARESLRDVTRRLDDDRAALLAVQALRINLRLPGQPQYLVEDALQQATQLESPNHDLLAGDTAFNAVAFSLDGLIAAGGKDHILRVWDLHKRGEPPILLQAPDGRAIWSVAFSRDRRWLAAGLDRDGIAETGNAVLLWNLRNLDAPPAAISGARGRSYVAFSPDSNHLAAGGSDQRGVQVWDMRDLHAPPQTFEVKNRGFVNWLEFSPDSARLAISNGAMIQLWNAHDPHSTPVVFQLPPDPNAKPDPFSAVPPLQIQSHAFGVVTFSPDGTHLAAGSPDALAEWDLRRPENPPVLLRPRIAMLGAHVKVAYSPDGDRLAVTLGNSFSIWNPRDPKAAPTELRAFSSIGSLAYSADGVYLAAATSTGMRMWEVGNFSESQPAIVHTQPDSALEVSRGTVVYSPDFTRLATASTAGLRVLDLRNSSLPPVTLYGREGQVGSVALSPDNVHLAGVRANSLWMWDLRNPGAPPRSLGRYSVFAFSPDGLRFAARGASNVIDIWDLRRPDAPPAQIQGNPETNRYIPSLTFTPDSRQLVFSAGTMTEVWELSRPGSPSAQFSVPNPLRFVTTSADGTRIAGLDQEHGTVGVWDLRHPGAPMAVFQPQFGSVSALSLSSDGSRLAAGMGPGIEMWDLRNPSAPAVLILARIRIRRNLNMKAVSFSADGKRLTAGNVDGAVVVWRLGLDAADYLCEHIWRNLSMTEWSQYVGDDIPYERTCPALPPGVAAPGANRP